MIYDYDCIAYGVMGIPRAAFVWMNALYTTAALYCNLNMRSIPRAAVLYTTSGLYYNSNMRSIPRVAVLYTTSNSAII